MIIGLWHAHQRLYESQCDQSSTCTEVRVCFSTHGLKCMQIRNDCRILLSCLLRDQWSLSRGEGRGDRQ